MLQGCSLLVCVWLYADVQHNCLCAYACASVIIQYTYLVIQTGNEKTYRKTNSGYVLFRGCPAGYDSTVLLICVP